MGLLAGLGGRAIVGRTTFCGAGTYFFQIFLDSSLLRVPIYLRSFMTLFQVQTLPMKWISGVLESTFLFDSRLKANELLLVILSGYWLVALCTSPFSARMSTEAKVFTTWPILVISIAPNSEYTNTHLAFNSQSLTVGERVYFYEWGQGVGNVISANLL